jgi:hypothetical protein
MTANTKSLILLATTLIVGFVLGLFADATLVRGRRDRIEGMRRPPGLVARLEEVIQPHSDAQRDSIHTVLDQFARGTGQIQRDINTRMRARFDSLRVLLSPMLDAQQKERLSEEVSRMPLPGEGRGGRGRGGRGGPPPDGFGPPPDGRGPPPPGRE